MPKKKIQDPVSLNSSSIQSPHGFLDDLGPKSSLDIDIVKENVAKARKAHEAWWSGTEGNAGKSFEYYKTIQKPSTIPDDITFYAQMNLVKKDHDGAMGTLSGSDISWDVRASSDDDNELRRIELHKSVLNWQAREVGFKDVIFEGASDYRLCGMGILNMRWNPYAITKIHTLGAVGMSRRFPKHFRLDPASTDRYGLTGTFTFSESRMTCDQFEKTWGVYFKKVGINYDIEEIKTATLKTGHWDHSLNEVNTPTSRFEFTLLEYEYYDVVYRPLVYRGEFMKDSSGKPIEVPVREYKIALIAGDKIYAEYKAPFSDLGYWSNILMPNNHIDDKPYCIANFPELLPIQDLVNVMLSMTLHSQARQISAPIIALANSITTGSKPRDIGGINVIEYKIPDGFEDMNIPAAALKPTRMRHGQMDTGWFGLLNWIMSNSERVKTQDVLQGTPPAGVESGVALGLLQNAASQPQQWEMEKLRVPISRAGNSFHYLIQNNLQSEVEVPAGEFTKFKNGLIINHIVNPDELLAIAQQARQDPDMLARMDMITVKRGDDSLTLVDFFKDEGIDPQSPESMAKAIKDVEDGKIEFIENDLSHGSFEVSASIDTQAERSRAERAARAQALIQPMSAAGAPFTAIKYFLNAVGDPQAEDIMRQIKSENQVWQTAKQMVDQQEAAGGQEAQQQTSGAQRQ